MQTASKSGTLETLDDDLDTADATYKSKMVQVCNFIQSFTGNKTEVAEYTFKCK